MSVKILYCCAHDPSQAAPHPFMAAYWLRSQGHEVSMICQGEGLSKDLCTPFGSIRTRFLPGRGRGKFQKQLFLALLRSRKTHPDAIIYLHGHNTAPAAVMALIGVPSRRVIYHTQDYLEPGRFPFWEFFERRLARRADHVICNEPNRGRFFASHYELKRFPTVVPTYLPRDWPRPHFEPELRRRLLAQAGWPAGKEAHLLMHQGAFAGVRCGETLVRALGKLPRHFLSVFTGMAQGSPAVRDLRTVATNAGVNKRIIALDRLSFDEMQRYTAACDVGILLYPNDGVGNFYQAPGRLTQYLACGLPVLASDFPALELLILKHELGVVCDPTCPEAIARGLSALLEIPPEQRHNRAARLRTLAANELCYDLFAARLEHAVENAAHPPGR